MLFRLTRVLSRLTGVLIRLTRVLFSITWCNMSSVVSHGLKQCHEVISVIKPIHPCFHGLSSSHWDGEKMTAKLLPFFSTYLCAFSDYSARNPCIMQNSLLCHVKNWALLSCGQYITFWKVLVRSEYCPSLVNSEDNLPKLLFSTLFLLCRNSLSTWKLNTLNYKWKGAHH